MNKIQTSANTVPHLILPYWWKTTFHRGECPAKTSTLKEGSSPSQK